MTLLDVELEQLLGSDTVVARLQSAVTADDIRAALKDMPGVKVTLDREVTIEFAPVP